MSGADNDTDERQRGVACSLEAADHLYAESAELSEAAATKARQAYTDTLKTLTEAESLQPPTTATNVSAIQDVADDIKQQVSSADSLLPTTLVEQSDRCVCVGAITFELNDLSRICLACWFILILSRSSSKVKVIDEISRSREAICC